MENYLFQIFKLRKDFSEREKELIEKAYKFAEKSYSGQKLDGTEYPYFMHPAYAGFLLAKWKRGAEEICAGFLHDVYEDCEIHLDVLRRLFGHRVTFLVDGMSWERRWNPKEKMYLKDWEHFHKKRLDYITQDIGLLYVLFSDELSNLDDIFPDKYKKLKKLSKEKLIKKKKRWSYIMKILVPLYKELGLKKLVSHVENKIKPVTGNMKSEISKYISRKDIQNLKKEISKNQDIEELK
jgi:GTP diphosphokinase / guanosine-3',5'-bis(diphosphate) 3'-diphosphatase